MEFVTPPAAMPRLTLPPLPASELSWFTLAEIDVLPPRDTEPPPLSPAPALTVTLELASKALVIPPAVMLILGAVVGLLTASGAGPPKHSALKSLPMGS